MQATQVLHVSGSNLMENPSLKINKINAQSYTRSSVIVCNFRWSWGYGRCCSAVSLGGISNLVLTGDLPHIDNIIDMIAQRNEQVKEKFAPTLHL